FTPDGNTLISWDHAGNVHLWNVATGREIRQFQARGYPESATGKPGAIAPGAIAPGGMTLYTSGAISPDGRLLALGSQFGFLVVYDLATGQELLHSQVRYASQALAFSPDGKMLAC